MADSIQIGLDDLWLPEQFEGGISGVLGWVVVLSPLIIATGGR